jgi:hypothetical protein
MDIQILKNQYSIIYLIHSKNATALCNFIDSGLVAIGQSFNPIAKVLRRKEMEGSSDYLTVGV